MGCLQSSEAKSDNVNDDDVAKEKVYSWDKRKHINPNDYIISDLKNETVGKLPGQVDGQQFVIQNCEDCKIFIFDHSATVTVDDSTNCQIFIGPSKGSVYIRDCKDCKFVIACQQFRYKVLQIGTFEQGLLHFFDEGYLEPGFHLVIGRTRDCKRLDIFLCCNTQPIIESSSGMKFACFQYFYAELEDQFEKAGLSLYNNNWSTIHDFTPADEENTWTLLSENSKVEDYVPFPPVDDFPSIEVSTDYNSSIVPLTLGSRRKLSDESCLVVFYAVKEIKKSVKFFLQEIYSKTACPIVQTKQVRMTQEDTKRVFGDQFNMEAIHQGAVIGLEINGDNSIALCNDILDSMFEGRNKSEFVFASTTMDTAAKNIDDFYNFVDITMY